jgi:hypothetical protein
MFRAEAERRELAPRLDVYTLDWCGLGLAVFP